MTPLRVLLARIVSTLTGRRRDADLDADVQSHLDLLAAEHALRGLSPEAARAAARRDFGGVQQTKDSYRDQHGLPWLDDLGRDVRHAARALAKAPGFTAIAVVTLALGIGANTAIFSIVNSVLLTPLPYYDSDRLVRLVTQVPPGPEGGPPRRANVVVSPAELDDLSSRTRTLSHAGMAGGWLVNWGGHEPRMQGARVSASVFPMLGVQPLLGRVLGAADEAPDAEPAILLSYSTWQRHFAGDPNVLGQTMTLEVAIGPAMRTTYTVVGVMPDAFEFPRREAQFWAPYSVAMSGAPAPRGPFVARLADGVSIEAAAAEAIPIVRELRGPQTGPTPATYELVGEQDELVMPVRPALLMLTAAVGFVLLIACVNVANLLLARTAARHREMAIRAALGASRGRLVRLVLGESLMLACLGGIGGTILAFAGVRVIQTLATTVYRFDLGIPGTTTFPRMEAIQIDASVLLFTLATSVMTGVLFGLAPALQHLRSAPADALKDSAGTRAQGVGAIRRMGLRGALVIAEVGMAIVLLVGGGLLMNSFLKLSGIDPGYDAGEVLTFQVSVPSDRFPAARMRTVAEDLVARLQSIPGVEAAAYANQLPMVALRDTAGGLWRTPDPARRISPDGADARLVSRDYLKVMGIPVVAGRGLNEQDAAGRPRVLLINQALARRQFDGENPLEKTVYVGRDPVPWQIVGIVGDVRQFGLDREPEPQFFADVRQWSTGMPIFPVGAYHAVRVAGGASSIIPRVEAIVRELDAEALVFNVAPMEELVATTIARPRMYMVLLGIFAGVGLVLAVIGIYGVMAYSVAQRTREVGIRMALGAQRCQVMSLVLRQSIALTAIGISLGLAGAAAVSRYLEGMLFGITPLDPATFLGVAILFAVVAAVAAAVPALRATKVDPLVALRYE